jgi:hypothetical protein
MSPEYFHFTVQATQRQKMERVDGNMTRMAPVYDA